MSNKLNKSDAGALTEQGVKDKIAELVKANSEDEAIFKQAEGKLQQIGTNMVARRGAISVLQGMIAESTKAPEAVTK